MRVLLCLFLLATSVVSFVPLPAKLAPLRASARRMSAPLSDSEIFVPLRVVGSSTRFVVSLSSISYVMTSRTQESLTFLTLAIANAVIGKILKKVIDESRPDGSPVSDDRGMPSSHATSLSFICTAATFLYPVTWLPPALLAYTLASLQYRKLRGLHNYPQLAAGCLLGFTNAVAWYSLTDVAKFIDSVWGFDTVPIPIVTAVGGLGAAVVGWREVVKARRFVTKSKRN